MLENKTALITGASRGIGRAVAELFVERGARVIGTCTREADAEAFNQDLPLGPTCSLTAADFSGEGAVDDLLKRLEAEDRVDVLVNNAGINHIATAGEVDEATYQRVRTVNLDAPYQLARRLGLRMCEAGYGRIVNISSIWGVITKPGRSMYSVTKWGMVGFTKTLAVEFASANVLVNAVSPGFTETEMTRTTLSAEEIEALAQQVPQRRFASPREMAEVVAFLSSDRNGYIAGQNVVVDGGFTSV